MELSTFSMVVRFTLELEDQTRKFYEDAIKSGKFTQVEQVFTEFAQSSKKRKQDLEKAARESVDHSLLEPVSGLFEESYRDIPTNSRDMNSESILDAAKRLEECAQKFYLEAGEKISFIAGVAKLYKRYSQDRARALTSLRSLS